MKFALRCLRSAVLLLTGAFFLLGSAISVVDSAVLLRARAWPRVPAAVERCELTLRYGKHDVTWEAHAVFRYGSGQSAEYDTTWQPAGAPVYSRSPDPELNHEQIAALTKTYCDAAANDGLRVSPMFPGIARRNEAVVTGTWKSELGFGTFSLLIGLMVSAGSISMLPWVEDRKKRSTKRRARPARNRVGSS
ncbi:DUF3592 domain-containing protein [Burkholderia ubonensis]|uniref:Uncharacterized protein n=1 Tax=Burkholderia ubonensis TaxID=101571 RepID=A0A119U2U5_9BURK|nr:hypothetical protein [Burkholderia ubonensis]KVD05098.1 hypothetical protein WI77_27830 [Burkholderia ubonensis]KVD31717.1 hypothetical protein WI84_24225 [Burkholderia ubonensis]KVD48795.1 hypothetical protein WI85_16320 [Burkholderia ubonensis]KVG39009.1 hypothetical protein WJ31_11565 [Burkholderia ubonensis]KVO72054.1 hypothetical protein WJ79_19925 [Burkholderia ubonensis]